MREHDSATVFVEMVAGNGVLWLYSTYIPIDGSDDPTLFTWKTTERVEPIWVESG